MLGHTCSRQCSKIGLVICLISSVLFLVSLVHDPAAMHATATALLGQSLEDGRKDRSLHRPGSMENLSNLTGDDPKLVQHLRERVLVAPSREPYNLRFGVHDNDPSDGQNHVIDEIFAGMRDGFYVECGAFTGEVLSNTLFFEMQRGWRGLLLEPDNKNYAKLVSRNRKAWTANACLGETSRSNQVMLLNHAESYASRILHNDNSYERVVYSSKNSMQLANCFPLQAFLLALNTTTVDYLSLDVEGSEYKVLSSIPWGDLNIKTLSVEYNLIPEGRDSLISLMSSHGYLHYMEFNAISTHDFIFVKKALVKQLPGLLKKEEQDRQYPLLVTERAFRPILYNTWLKLFE